VAQLPVAYPAFVLYCNYPDHVKPSYRQFIENQLRKHFSLTGASISVYFREK
jgi:GTP-binding protein